MAGESVSYGARAEVKESVTVGNELAAVAATVHKSDIHSTGQFSTTTTPDVDSAWSDRHTQAAATDTLTLSALPRAGGRPNLDLTGKRIRVLKVAAPAGNADPVTLAPGGVQGYPDFPTVELAPGEAAVFIFSNTVDLEGQKAAIVAGDTVAITGTIGDSVDIVLAAG